MDLELMHPRDQITMIMERIYGYGMTTTSGGNLSIRDEDGGIWITPAGTDKGVLKPEDVVRVAEDGCATGFHEPSSELPFHAALYRRRPDVNAVLHAHPPALVSFSIMRRIPDTRIIPKARDICGDVGFAGYAMPGSEELGENIASAFEKGFKTVLLENHGVVTVGSSLFSAFQRFETLDFCGRLILKASILGAPRPLRPDQLSMIEHKQNYLPEYVPGRRSSREKELRKRICEMVQRAYDQRLITSTEGTFSCRLDAESFVITPYGKDRKYLEVSDLIVIRSARREQGRIPSRSVRLHHRIYDEHPDIHAVIIAHPTNVMAFGVSGRPFDTRVIPESYIVLRDIPVIPFGPQFIDVSQLSARISTSSPLLMVENDCLLTTGKDLLEAYDRLEVAEFSAKAIIAAKPVGDVIPIRDNDIAKLEHL